MAKFRQVAQAFLKRESLERRFYGKSTAAEILPWNFYGELAATDGELLKRMLAAHPRKCNILLYGAPGTGKTSFARTLANALGRTAWEIKQGDDNGKNMKAEARMMGIQICNDQEDADTSLMIVDEADELLRGSVSLKTLGNLAPGDYRTVRQETFYLNETPSNIDLITALREECLIKKDGEKHAPVGFVA